MGENSLGALGKIFKSLLFIFGILSVGASKSPQYKITEICDGKTARSSEVIEGAVIRSQGDRKVNCVITFQTDTILQRFMLRFEKLKLDCNDHLIIYDGAYTTSTHKVDLSCRSTLSNVGTIYTHSNHVTLNYITDEWGPEANGFKLIITAFKHKQNTCLHFRCQVTKFCIHQILTCDDVNHCGDDSDESPSLAMCPTAPLEEILGVSRTLLVVGAATLAALCCVCSVLVVGCLCQKTHARSRRRFDNDIQQAQSYQMNSSTNYGTNGTSFGTMVSEKHSSNYPARNAQHTIVLPPVSPGNRMRPASGTGRYPTHHVKVFQHSNDQRTAGRCGRQAGG